MLFFSFHEVFIDIIYEIGLSMHFMPNYNSNFNTRTLTHHMHTHRIHIDPVARDIRGEHKLLYGYVC
jgi:hypothetical protein